MALGYSPQQQQLFQPYQLGSQGMKPASRGNWFTGAPAQYQRTPTQTPQGMSFLDQILARAGQGLQDPQAGFQPIANEVTRQFQTETVPQLAERFTEGGGQNSAAFKGALGSAGTGLASKLAAMAAQYGLQNRQGLLQQGQLGLTPQFETQYKPENSGFLGQLLPILGAAGGAYLGGYSGSGKKDEAGKGIGQFGQQGQQEAGGFDWGQAASIFAKILPLLL